MKQLINTLLSITVGRAEFTGPSPPLFMVRRKVERDRQNK